jgi:hypothetical protein
VVDVDDKSGGTSSSIRYTSSQFFGFFNRSTWSASNTLIAGPTALALRIVSGAGTGQTLFEFDPNIQFYNPYVLNNIDPNRMLIGTASIYESRDRGDTLANLGFTGKFISSLTYGAKLYGTAKPDAFYVGTSGTGRPYILHRNGSGGGIVELANYPGVGVRDLIMDRQNLRSVFVVDEQDRVWASFDEGVTWRNLTANLGTIISSPRTVEVFGTDSYGHGTRLVVGGLGGVVQMRDPGTAGATWSRLGTNLPHGLVRDLRYNPKSDLLVAGILGRGAWTLPGSTYGAASMEWSAATAGSPAAEQALSLPADMPVTAPASQTAAPREVHATE